MSNCRIYRRYCRRYKSRLLGKCDKTCGYCKASSSSSSNRYSRPQTRTQPRPQPRRQTRPPPSRRTRPRAVNGNWGSWGSYSSCSVSCGGGVMRRTRQCNNPPASNGGRRCPGSSTESRRCATNRCPAASNRRPPPRRQPARPARPATSTASSGSSSNLRVCSRSEALKCYGYERRRSTRCKGGRGNSWFTQNCDFMCGKCTVEPKCEQGDERMCSAHRSRRRLACSRSWMIKIRCPNMCNRCRAGPKTLEQIIYRR